MRNTGTTRHSIICKAALMLAGLALLCTGCAVTGEKEIKELPSTMSKMNNRQKEQMRQKSPVRQHDKTYLGKYKMKLAEKRNLPGFFDQRIVLVEKAMTLPQSASRISQVAGIQIELSPRLKTAIEQDNKQQPMMDPMMAQASQGPQPAKMPLQFNGKLKHLIDQLTAFHNVSWEWADGEVYIYRLKTKTYDLVTGPGETLVENQISNESETNTDSTGEETGESKVKGYQTAEHKYEFNLWTKMVENIESMISDEGKVVATQSTGTITVTDTPSIHKDIQVYLDQVNDRLSRQVSISVKVYAFTINNNDSWGYSLKAAFEDLEGEFGVEAEGLNTADITDPASLFNAAILERSEDEDGYDRAYQQWEGSEAIIRALDKQGDVKLITSGSGIVMNNQPLPIQNTSRRGYLAKSEISQGETSTTSALESGSVTTGFALSAVPHILQNNEVVLRYNITLSKLDDIQTIEAAGSKIQTPEISSRNFMQQARMKLGQTLILAGFQKQSDEYGETKSAKGLLGWQKNGSTKKEMVFISIAVNEVDV